MGTSKSPKTPTGGPWTSPKKQLTENIGGGPSFDAERFVRSALGALGGIAMKPRSTSAGDLRRVSGATGGGGTRGRRSPGGGTGGAPSGGGGAALSGVLQGLGGFGSQVGSTGLDSALGSLGLQELRGKPPAEVVARVAEHLSRSATGRQAEVLETSSAPSRSS